MMSGGYTDVFGGSTVQPSIVSYQALAFSANTTLVWPISNQTTSNIVSRWNDCTPSTSGLSLTMPDATQVSAGQDALFSNIGAQSFTIKDSSGGTITTVAAGTVVYLIVADNSTAAGTWRVTTFGGTTSAANAATLAGSGLLAAANTINTCHTVNSQNSNYTVVNGDRATTVLWTGGTGTLSLTAAATLGNNFFFLVRNAGTGVLTIDPNASEMIDGASTKTINQTESAFVICDGTGWYTVGYGRATTFSYSRLVKSVAGSADVTLTSAEASNLLQEYTGALTGNINVIVPTNINTWHVFNNTSGAFTLTVKTAAGTGVAVTQGNRIVLDCDATNVVAAQTAAAGTVTSITAGTGLSGGTITGSGTIAIQSTAVAAGSYGAADTVATFTVNAQGQLTTAAGTSIAIAASQVTSGTLPVARGGTGTTSSTGTGSVVLSDSAALTGTPTAPTQSSSDNSTKIATTAFVTTAVGSISAGAPTGFVGPFAGSSAPTGWLLCDGSAVSRATYAALFAVISTTYGSGDGSTTFNVPDIRGRAVFGVDNMGGSAANRVTNAGSGITGTTLGAAGGDQLLQSHNHTVSINGGNGGTTQIGLTLDGSNPGATYTSSTAGSGNSQNMPPAIILNYIIKQ